MPRHSVGKEIFKTKALLERRCKELKNKNMNKIITDKKDHLFLINLLLRHPQSEDKIGSGVSQFSVQQNGSGYCFFIQKA
jgi:hypothetical protein